LDINEAIDVALSPKKIDLCLYLDNFLPGSKSLDTYLDGILTGGGEKEFNSWQFPMGKYEKAGLVNLFKGMDDDNQMKSYARSAFDMWTQFRTENPSKNDEFYVIIMQIVVECVYLKDPESLSPIWMKTESYTSILEHLWQHYNPKEFSWYNTEKRKELKLQEIITEPSASDDLPQPPP
jgi:hypothetical protein